MVQLHITSETLARMKKIVGTTQVKDGDFLVNEMIDILEKKWINEIIRENTLVLIRQQRV